MPDLIHSFTFSNCFILIRVAVKLKHIIKKSVKWGHITAIIHTFIEGAINCCIPVLYECNDCATWQPKSNQWRKYGLVRTYIPVLNSTLHYSTPPPELLKTSLAAPLCSAFFKRTFQLEMHSASNVTIITISIIIILAFTSIMSCVCMHVSFYSVACSDCGQAVKSLRTRLTPSLIKFYLVILHGRQKDTAHLNPITSNQIFVCFFSFSLHTCFFFFTVSPSFLKPTVSTWSNWNKKP